MLAIIAAVLNLIAALLQLIEPLIYLAVRERDLTMTRRGPDPIFLSFSPLSHLHPVASHYQAMRHSRIRLVFIVPPHQPSLTVAKCRV
ncbi:hypothetical protein [Erwinia aphidicola]|uniref:hypothetical protein n=1 Tax=Erwinia aphidicola TaxID=68334 RepID=UPI003D2486E1